MSITSERIREQGFFHALADDAADEIEALERENEKLTEACKCFRTFVNMRGGSWAEMKEILDGVLMPSIKQGEALPTTEKETSKP